jgi:hypothetical protein
VEVRHRLLFVCGGMERRKGWEVMGRMVKSISLFYSR